MQVPAGTYFHSPLSLSTLASESFAWLPWNDCHFCSSCSVLVTPMLGIIAMIWSRDWSMFALMALVSRSPG